MVIKLCGLRENLVKNLRNYGLYMNSRFVTSKGSALQIPTFVAVVVVEGPLTTSLALPRSPPRKRDARRAARV